VQGVDADEREIILHSNVDVDEHGVVADGERAHLIVEAGNQPGDEVARASTAGSLRRDGRKTTRMSRLSASRIIASSAGVQRLNRIRSSNPQRTDRLT
jgi:hypothetical protein